MKTKLLVIICIVAVMMSLVSCGNKAEETDEPEEIEVISGDNEIYDFASDPTAGGIFSIDIDKLDTVMKANHDISSNFDISTRKMKSLSRVGDDYVFTKTTTVTGIKNDTSTINDDAIELIISMNYYADTAYPNEIVSNIKFKSTEAREQVDAMLYNVAESLLNSYVSQSMKSFNINDQRKDVYRTADVVIYLERKVQNYTNELGYYIESFKIDIVDNKSERFDGIVTDLDVFKLSENPNCPLFNTNAAEFGYNTKDIVNRLTNMYNNLYHGDLVSINDAYTNNKNEEVYSSYVEANIFNEEYEGPVNVNFEAIKKIDGNGEKFNLRINTGTFEFNNVVDCYYESELIIKAITDQEVQLDKYLNEEKIESKSFEEVINSDRMGGYPVVAKFEFIVSADGTSCHMEISMNTAS